VTGLFVGVRPALLSTVLRAVIAYTCFVPPRYKWGFQGVSDAAGFAVYLAAALAVVALIPARTRAADAAEHFLANRWRRSADWQMRRHCLRPLWTIIRLVRT
jgi:K+-sensing histidine kinase KdpD